jgi:hypothetical protein
MKRQPSDNIMEVDNDSPDKTSGKQDMIDLEHVRKLLRDYRISEKQKSEYLGNFFANTTHNSIIFLLENSSSEYSD